MAKLETVIANHIVNLKEQADARRAFLRWMMGRNCMACAVSAPPSLLHSVNCEYHLDFLTASEAREMLHECEWEVHL